jgi:hypothetical protein
MKKSHLGAVVVLTLAALIYLVEAIHFWDFSIDDIGISYRYARHLAEGWGLTWNIEQPPVEGYSNLLWVLILGGAKSFGFDIETSAKVLGFVLGFVNLILLTTLLRQLMPDFKYWWVPAVLVPLTPEWTAWMVSGLEIALLCTFLLTSLLAMTLRRRSQVVLLCLSFPGLILSRPEGLLMVGTVFVWLFFSERGLLIRDRVRAHWVPAFAIAATVVGLMLFRLEQYGYPLANTVYAKFSTDLPSLARILEWWLHGLPLLIAWMFFFRSKTPNRHQSVFASGFSIVIAQTLVVLPVHPIMYFLHRYQIAVLPLLALPLPFLLRRLDRYGRWVVPVILLAIAGWSVRGWSETDYRLKADRDSREKQRCVIQLLESLPGVPTSALVDAGRIPYWSDLPFLDVWGLCDTETAHQGFSIPVTLAKSPQVYIMSAEVTLRDPSDKQSGITIRAPLSRDAEIEQSQLFRSQYALWRLCSSSRGTADHSQYDYAVFLNIDWARRVGIADQLGARSR